MTAVTSPLSTAIVCAALAVTACDEPIEITEEGWTWPAEITIKPGADCKAPEGYTCEEPSSWYWCDALHTLAVSHYIPQAYSKILFEECAADVDGACYECWNLSNYCLQVGRDCDDLENECRCIAESLGEI